MLLLAILSLHQARYYVSRANRSKERVEKRNAEALKVSDVTGDQSELMEFSGGGDQCVGLRECSPLSPQLSAQLSAAAGDLRGDRKKLAVLVEKGLEPLANAGIWLPGKSEKNFFERDDTQSNRGDTLGPFDNSAVGMAASEFADDVGVTEICHRGL